jgi:hypothetical protein
VAGRDRAAHVEGLGDKKTTTGGGVGFAVLWAFSCWATKTKAELETWGKENSSLVFIYLLRFYSETNL